jgi:hypothetical protein
MEQNNYKCINPHTALPKKCVTNIENKTLRLAENKNIQKVKIAEGNCEETASVFYQHKIKAKKFELF